MNSLGGTTTAGTAEELLAAEFNSPEARNST
jgi:hypothetical protein